MRQLTTTVLVLAVATAAGCLEPADRCDLELCEVWTCGAARPGCPCSDVCEQVSSGCSDGPVYARDPASGACHELPSSCDVPSGWDLVTSLDDCAEGTTPCRGHGDCPEGLCDIRSCAVDALGTCVDAPEACPEAVDPVFSCDGEEFPNDCERLAAGARLADVVAPLGTECSDYTVWTWDPGAGQCVELESDCLVAAGVEFFLSRRDCEGAGARCSAETPCSDGLVCDLPSCDAVFGTCVPVPGDCVGTMEGAGTGAVCGCDGVTYRDDCERLLGGVGVAHLGSC